MAADYRAFGAGIATDEDVGIARAVGIFENLSPRRGTGMHHFSIVHEPLKLLIFAAQFVVAVDELRDAAFVQADRRVLRVKYLADLFSGSI